LAKQYPYPQAYPQTKIRLRKWADALCARSRVKRIALCSSSGRLLVGAPVAVLGVLIVALALLFQFAAPPTRDAFAQRKTPNL
jgi:hypothetical protein